MNILVFSKWQDKYFLCEHFKLYNLNSEDVQGVRCTHTEIVQSNQEFNRVQFSIGFISRVPTIPVNTTYNILHHKLFQKLDVWCKRFIVGCKPVYEMNPRIQMGFFIGAIF